MDFDSLLIIKFNKLYIFVLENIEQEHVFNVISISPSAASDLDHLVTVMQCFELTVKLFLKLLASLMVLTETNDMKALMKAMKAMVLVMTATVP